MLFSGKIPFHFAARLTVRFWVPHCYDLPLFASIYSRLFAIIRTIRDYSHYSYYSLFANRDYSLFAIRNYLLFMFSRHPCWTEIHGKCHCSFELNCSLSHGKYVNIIIVVLLATKKIISAFLYF